MIIRYVEGYIDLSSEQKDLIERKTQVLSQWHRQHELGLYASQIDILLSITPKEFSQGDLSNLQSAVRERYQVFIQKVAPDIVVLTRSLSDQQVENFVEAIAKKHQNTADRLNKRTPAESRKAYAKRIKEAADEWLGSVTEQQENVIDLWSQEIIATQAEWIAYQSRLRAEIRKLLDNRHNPMYFNTHFNQLLYFPENYYSESLKTKRQDNLKLANKYIVEIIQSMNDKQTKHLKKELKGWREIILDLQQG